MTRESIRRLTDDLIDALDGVLELASQSVSALLLPYASWPTQDREVESLGPVSGAATKRHYPRTLGAPANLASYEYPDDLVPLGARLARAGGRTRALQRVVRATTRLSHLVSSYEQGLYQGMPVAQWRALVGKIDKEVGERVDEAKQDIEAWERDATGGAGPDASVLKDQVYVFAETLVRMFGGEIKLDAARKMISRGRLGKVHTIGKRKAVLLAEMLEATQRADDGPRALARKRSAASAVANLPRRSRRARAPQKASRPPSADQAEGAAPSSRAGP